MIDRVGLLIDDTEEPYLDKYPDPARKYFATTYADEWSGSMGGWFRSWYICLHGCKHSEDRPKITPSTCGTLIPSKLWPRKDEEDPLAEKQKWYCWQGHKYKASWGQVVEFYTVGKRLLYAYATIPSGNIQDIRAIAIQEKSARRPRPNRSTTA